MEIYAPIVKAQDLRRIVTRARKNLEFRRSVTEHQVHRFGHTVVSDIRIGMHLAIGAVHTHFESHNHVGIFREHRRQLLHMLQHPFVIRRHVAAAVVPRIITNAHNHVPAKTADAIKRFLQHVQGIFGQVLVLATNRISARRIDAQPGMATEFRNLGTQVKKFRPWFPDRLAARRFQMQHLRRIEPAVEIVKRRHRIGRVNILFHETSRKKRGLQERRSKSNQHKPFHRILLPAKTDMDSTHIRNIHSYREHGDIFFSYHVTLSEGAQIRTCHLDIESHNRPC